MFNFELLNDLSLNEIRELAQEFEIKGTNKKEIIKNIKENYIKLEKFSLYTFLKQLGKPGKDGTTFLAKDKKSRLVAIKFFKDDKCPLQIKKEADLQKIASKNDLSPKIYKVNLDDKYICMDFCDKTLFEILQKRNGKLTKKLQYEIINIFKTLDKIKIFHNDPNLLNFMFKNNKLIIIDFGFAIPINSYCIRKYGENPNMKYMPAKLLHHLKKVYPDIEYPIISEASLSFYA